VDPELKQYLESMEGRIYAYIDRRITESESRVVNLITAVKESLEREMDARFNAIERRLDEMNARFDTQANRLDRQAALIQTGARWMNRHQDWAERIDKDLDVKSEQVIDHSQEMDRLRRRMDEMDRRSN
jgi:hypothetical protein